MVRRHSFASTDKAMDSYEGMEPIYIDSLRKPTSVEARTLSRGQSGRLLHLALTERGRFPLLSSCHRSDVQRGWGHPYTLILASGFYRSGALYVLCGCPSTDAPQTHHLRVGPNGGLAMCRAKICAGCSGLCEAFGLFKSYCLQQGPIT